MVSFKQEIIEEIDTLDQPDREVVCETLFHTVNWFREVCFFIDRCVRCTCYPALHSQCQSALDAVLRSPDKLCNIREIQSEIQSVDARSVVGIDLFHNVGILIYFFICMIISLSDLVSMCKIQKNSYFPSKPERLIDIPMKG